MSDTYLKLAIFGAEPLFADVKPTSNLFRPDFAKFLEYSKVFYEHKRYTNDGFLAKHLEERLAAFHGVRHCVVVIGAFWGLVLGLSALAKPGKTEVVLPSLTYRRMDDIVAWAGLTPHFCDVDPKTLSITADTVRPCISDRTALILSVHPIVNCCAASEIEDLGKRLNIPVLFDSVESAYEIYDGRRIGGFGGAEVFSLHASKLINGFEGGYITTNDGKLAHQLANTKRFGFEVEDVVSHGMSLNAKLNEMHAAMSLAALDDIEQQVASNLERYRAYRELLSDIAGIRLLEYDESERPDYKNIVVELTDQWLLTRTQTINLLHAENILVRPYYSPPLHHKDVGYPRIVPPLPATEQACERYLLLPCGAHVQLSDIADIVTLMRRVSREGCMISERLARRGL